MIGDDKPTESVSQLVSSRRDDYRTATLGHADLAMLTYVDKLTRTPGAMESADVAALRDAGFGEAAILDICQVAAYYAFVNRLAEGLGVELET